MTETQLQSKVINYLKNKGVWHVKVWGGGYQRAGIPDILACVNGHFVAIELKSDDGRTSKLQEYNIARIKESGGTAMVLRPDGFKSFQEWVSREVKKPID